MQLPEVLQDDRWQPNSADDDTEDYAPRWMRSVAQNGSGTREQEHLATKLPPAPSRF